MLNLRSHALPILGAAALAAGGGAASSALAAGGDAQMTVGPQTSLHAGQTAPFDAPGVRAIRRGKPIPAGYELVGRRVTVDRGTSGSVGAAFELSCPAGKRARTIGLTGENGPNLIGSYLGHHHVRLVVWSPPRKPRSTGTSYVVCR
jgi:hypothetical protein